MFYKLLNLSGHSPDALKYLMIDTPVDLGFLYKFMREVSRVNQVFKDYGKIALSIHCENPEIINAFTQYMRQHETGNALKDYSDARPAFQEKLAIKETEILAAQANCPVNLLHLSSIDALEAGKEAVKNNPGLNILLESTLHHLGLSNDMTYGRHGKVNPPIRSREDVEALWQAIMKGDVKTVVSDHACSSKKIKEGDLWTSLAGFGGTELMFPLLLTDGHRKRGISLQKIAEITSYYPAVYHELYPKKGTIAIGSDADLVLVDLKKEGTIDSEKLHNKNRLTPYHGRRVKGMPRYTIVRGQVVMAEGEVKGPPVGEWIRPGGKLLHQESLS